MTRQKPFLGDAVLHGEKLSNGVLPQPGATVPYWRSQLHWLDEHRSSDNLPTDCDIVVIGAGLSGVSFVYHLLQMYEKGCAPSIVLLEARQVCSGATGRNGGHVKVRSTAVQSNKRRHGVATAEDIARFVTAQIDALKNVIEKEEIECEFELRRSFDVFLDEKEASAARKDFQNSVRAKESWTRDIAPVPEQYIEQITSVRGAKFALSMPACSFWPYKLVTGLLEKCIGSINLQTNTVVTRVVGGTKYSDVHTSRGTIRATRVVFASNAYTGGIAPTYTGRIVPYKGSNSHIVSRIGAIAPQLTQTYNIAFKTGFTDYLNPRPDGSIVVGGAESAFRTLPTRESWYDNWDDASLLPGIQEYYEGYMQRTFRGWTATDEKLWTGIMGQTSDGLPHVGRVVGRNNQFIMAGFNGGGMTMIYLTARGLARIVKDDVVFSDTGIPLCFETSAERLAQMPMTASMNCCA